jgi:hypothetical protein
MVVPPLDVVPVEPAVVYVPVVLKGITDDPSWAGVVLTKSLNVACTGDAAISAALIGVVAEYGTPA